ncbi:transposable element Tc3 transposase [Trichonephila clavipes]|nr:transposable element Tc3 transposase [Trichonephila clavipes]
MLWEASCWSKLSSDKQEHPNPNTLTEEWDKLPQQLLDNVVQRRDGADDNFLRHVRQGLTTKWLLDFQTISLILTTNDGAHFWLNGYVNKQNCRIWSEANPQVYVEIPLHPEKLTVWCALWAGGILLQKR